MRSNILNKNALIGILTFVALVLAIANISKELKQTSVTAYTVVAKSLNELISPSPTPLLIMIKNTNWWEYPDEIETIPLGEIGVKTIVNKRYKLPANYVPSDLIQLQSTVFLRVRPGIMLQNDAANALYKMARSAKEDGIDLFVRSGYRSYSTQINTYNYWVKFLSGDTAAADKVSARAGHSEHQLGTAVDFSTNEVSDVLSPGFANTKAYKWLLENANDFGFKLSYPRGKEYETGYSFEPWHWRWWSE